MTGASLGGIVTAAALPGGAGGLPPGSTITEVQMVGAGNACTGVVFPPALRTPQQSANLARLLSVTQLPESFVITDESAYASVVPAANLSTAVVVEAEPSHCGFTGAEIVAGWESLRAWMAGGSPKPSPAMIQNTCQLLLLSGVDGPCRIDAAYVIPDLDTRVRPR